MTGTIAVCPGKKGKIGSFLPSIVNRDEAGQDGTFLHLSQPQSVGVCGTDGTLAFRQCPMSRPRCRQSKNRGISIIPQMIALGMYNQAYFLFARLRASRLCSFVVDISATNAKPPITNNSCIARIPLMLTLSNPLGRATRVLPPMPPLRGAQSAACHPAQEKF